MQLTQSALDVHIGAAGKYFIAVTILFFAFTSIIGNYSYAESAMAFLGLDGRGPIALMRAASLAMVVWGALQSVQTVFDFADAAMGVMATINLVAILLLSGTVVTLTRDYVAQRRAGGEPTFRSGDFPEIGRGVDHDVWK
jgi:AGCS family alanine or glycine:cation symporter